MSAIKEALLKLDPSDDSHWTSDGLPRLNVVSRFCGSGDLSRQDVTDADPEFCRDKAERPPPDPLPEPQAEEPSQMALLDQEISGLVSEKEALERQIAGLSARRDSLQEGKFRENSPSADTAARLEYVRRQNQVRLERAGRRQSFLQSGVTVDDIDPRSPMDRAFSRQTKRGANRPARPAPVDDKE